MPSPIGHSLIGLAIGSAALMQPCRPGELARKLYGLRWTLLLCMVLANLPDLDYVPGLLIGDMNRFHHHYTHTLGFALLAVAGVWLVGRGGRPHLGGRYLLLALVLLLSHLAADIMTRDGSEPYGIMALWPIADTRVLSPVSLFPAFKKDYFLQLFDPRNLRPVLFEILWCGGLLAAVWWWKVHTSSCLEPRPRLWQTPGPMETPPAAESTDALGIIAGRGGYPIELARSARKQGKTRLFAVAFKGETNPAIAHEVDEVAWLKVGQLQAMLDAFARSGVREAVMAGQITPTSLFRVRPDRAMLDLLGHLEQRNAHTIFGAVGAALLERGVELKDASLFMEDCMPEAGVMTSRAPDERERADIELGRRVARGTSGLEIGQTVVLKEGTIVAVEAFEGTDATLRRAGKLAGAGTVVVKSAKRGHDMRFDIPVIGERTIRVLRRAKASALAVEAGRCIVLDRSRVVAMADQAGISMVAVEPDNGEDKA